MCGYVAAEREDGAEVHLEDFVPVVAGELVRVVAPLDAGGVDEDVDGVLVGEDLGDERCDGGLGGEVCGVDGALATELLYSFFCSCIRSVSLRRS